MFTNLFSHQVLLPLLILIFLLIFAVINYKRRPLFAFGLFWFLVSYVPMSNLVAKINALAWDHWFYTPSIGIVFCLASFMQRPQKRDIQKAALVILIPAVISLGGLTISRNKHWQNTESVSRFILKYEPRSAKTWNNLAMSLDSRGEFMQAIDYYLKAISISDTYPQTHHNLANSYQRLKQYSLAEKEYLKAIELDANFYHSYARLGNLYLSQGKKEKAKDHFRKALAIYPYMPAVRKFLEDNDK